MTIVNNHQSLMDKSVLENAVLMFNYSLVLFDFWMEFSLLSIVKNLYKKQCLIHLNSFLLQ